MLLMDIKLKILLLKIHNYYFIKNIIFFILINYIEKMATNKKVEKVLVEKVLIVVDVANCFIAKGSFAQHQLDKNQLSENYEQIKQISNLIDNNNHIIFTRDFHPQYHASLAYGINKDNKPANYNVTYPFHCRDLSRTCFNNTKNLKNKKSYQDPSTIKHDSIIEYFNKNIENIPTELITKIMLNNMYESNILNIFLQTKILDQQIIGPNLTFLYYGTKYYKTIYELTKDEKYTIGLYLDNKPHLKEPSIKLIDIKDPLIVDKKTFVQLTKGQFCNYESYSAFNYHLKLTNNRNISKPSKIPLKADKNNSTGLNEYISKKILNNNNKKNNSIIDITVCGLVGDICVINTILQGYLMIKKVYRLDNYKFTYSLAGTLFVGGGNNGFQLKPIINDAFFNAMEKRILYLLLNETYQEDIQYFNEFEFDLLDYEGKIIGNFSIIIDSNNDSNNGKITIVYKHKNIESYEKIKKFNSLFNENEF